MIAMVRPSLEETAMTLETLNPPGLSTPRGYSQAVVASGSRTLYVAGQVSLDGEGTLVAPGDVVGQAKQAFLNVRIAVETAGGSITDVARVTWYVVGYRSDMLPALATARRESFGDHAPASTLVGVEALAQAEYLVEVEAVAVLS
jgi:enamine deaminase RidA (YjgF/YER057c/UK114 family)